MEIRAALAADQNAIEAVAAGAFEEETDGQIVRLLRALSDTGALRASLVAVADDEIVGHVALSRSWVDARERLVDVLVLSPLSVSPDRQRAGIGTALIAAALAEAERLGAPAVFLEGSWDYYGPRGFSAATPLGFGSPSPRIPERAFQVARLPAYEAWMTGTFVYCDAFWTHDAVGLRDPLLAQVEAHSRDHVG